MLNNTEILLTIGMIVKNEEDKLEKSLKALEKLRKKIPCQLIIIDTGSTDRTLEIAKKYGDIVDSFQWSDDFAAARNYGLSMAAGKWFMYLDADEFIEDTEALEKFFSEGEYEKYDNAGIYVRNFIHLRDEHDYIDHEVCRLFNMKEKRQFVGRIHEYIPRKGNHIALKIHARHYSYANDLPEEEKIKKSQRNLTILKECAEEEPDNIRFKQLLAQEYKAIDDMIAFRAIIDEAFDAVNNDEKNPYYCYFLRYKTSCCKDYNIQKGIELLEKYFSGRKKFKVWDLDLKATLADLYHVNKEYDKALRCCDEYLEMYKQYEKGKIADTFGILEAPPNFNSKNYMYAIVMLKAKGLICTEKYDEAGKLLDSCPIESFAINEYKETLLLALAIGSKTGEFSLIGKLFKDGKIRKDSEALIENYISDNAETASNVAKGFAEAFNFEKILEKDKGKAFAETALSEQGKYVMMQMLRYAVSSNRNPEKVIKSFFAAEASERRNNTNWSELSDEYGEMLAYGILAGDENAETILAAIDTDNLSKYNRQLFSKYGSGAEIIFANLKNRKNGAFSLKGLFYRLCMLEMALLNSNNMETDRFCQLMILYVEYGQSYMTKVYSDMVLRDLEVEILPRSQRFIYFTGKAIENFAEGNLAEGTNYLKLAVRAYPVMSSAVSRYADYIVAAESRKNSMESSKNQEFAEYARTVKNKILEIADRGMQKEALQLLDGYIQINPNDIEGITELKRRLAIDN